MADARWFPNGCVASPHYLASAAGLAVLADGGNALDAAIATNLTLGAVAPYNCGFGGDLFAIVWDGALHAYNGSGRAPAAATRDEVQARAESDAMPAFGPLTVTVPGAVDAWFALLDRFGTRSFATLAAPAFQYARDGFVPSRGVATVIQRRRDVYDPAHGWHAIYGAVEPDRLFRQPELAHTIETLMTRGPRHYYDGEIAVAIAAHVQHCGGLLAASDLGEHQGEWVSTISSSYRDLVVHQMPPNSQGLTALMALNIIEHLQVEPAESAAREHFHIEAIKLALADRDAYLTDPSAMTVDARSLIAKDRGRAAAAGIDPLHAGHPVAGRAASGGTISLCTADRDGMCVSLIQSNYAGFGSGVTVPGWGINLQNRGAYFSLDPSDVNVIAPGKRTLHTLMPAMVLRGGRPWLALGAMGADGQAQTQVQVLTKLVDDRSDVQDAIDAPRWFVSPADFAVTCESRFDPGTIEGLRSRGHELTVTGRFDSLMGHANAILVDPDGHGYRAASDPRSEGAALGH